jgi:hypothetical protein
MQYKNNFRPKMNSFGEPMRSRKYDALNAAMEMRDEESDDTEEEQEEAPVPRPKIRRYMGGPSQGALSTRPTHNAAGGGVQAKRYMGAGSGTWISGAQRQAQSQAKSAARKKARIAATYGY